MKEANSKDEQNFGCILHFKSINLLFAVLNYLQTAVKQDLGHIGLEAAPRKPPDAVDKVYFLNDWQKNVFLIYKL